MENLKRMMIRMICLICDSSLDQYSVESHLKTKKPLDNIAER